MIQKLKTIGFAVLFTVLGVCMVQAQTSNPHPKLLVVLNKASWCHVCKEQAPKVQKELMPMLKKDKDALILINDITDEKTRAEAYPQLAKVGLGEFARNSKASGVLYFIDAHNQDILAKVSIAQPKEEIIKAYQEAKSKIQ